MWSMTLDYVDSAIGVISSAHGKANNSGIRSIQILESIGVVSGILGYLRIDEFSSLYLIGLSYILLLGCLGVGIDYLLKRRAAKKQYTLHFTKRSDNL
ncbi:MAG: hypothetical protein ACI83O_000065 [Patescibacteria group bacterium]|jgi:hypothetical protein